MKERAHGVHLRRGYLRVGFQPVTDQYHDLGRVALTVSKREDGADSHPLLLSARRLVDVHASAFVVLEPVDFQCFRRIRMCVFAL